MSWNDPNLTRDSNRMLISLLEVCLTKTINYTHPCQEDNMKSVRKSLMLFLHNICHLATFLSSQFTNGYSCFYFSFWLLQLLLQWPSSLSSLPPFISANLCCLSSISVSQIYLYTFSYYVTFTGFPLNSAPISKTFLFITYKIL